MASKVVLFSTAEEDFESLPTKERWKIAEALRALQDFPSVRKNIKKLKPPFSGYRKRVGDYRILFDVEDDIVYVHRIKNRKDAYKRK